MLFVTFKAPIDYLQARNNPLPMADLWSSPDWSKSTRRSKADGRSLCRKWPVTPLGTAVAMAKLAPPDWWNPIWLRTRPNGGTMAPAPRREWKVWQFDDQTLVETDRGVFVDVNHFSAERRPQVFTIPNVEHRREAIRYWSFNGLMDVIPHEVVHEDGSYQLIEVKDLTTSQRQWDTALFLKMVNPSTADIHVEGVDPNLADRTVQGALAYRNAGLVPEVIT